MGNWFADAVDNVGSFLHLPEIGISEALAGGKKTVNSANPVGVDITESPLAYGLGTAQAYDKAMATPVVSPTGIADSTVINGVDTGTGLGGGGTGGTGGGGVNMAAVSSYLSQLGALPEILQNLLTSNKGQFDSVMGGYKGEMENAERKYNTATTTNEQNKGNSIQAAQLAAAQGARGLKATLAAIGALGGTGELLANRAVAGEANRDIGTAKNVFDTNATSLTDAWNDTETANRKREADAAAAFENANVRSRGDVASQHQNIYAQLAQLYGNAGDTGTADSYVSKGVGFQPDVTAASRTAAPTYDRGKLAFTPAELAKYLGGQNDMSVDVVGGSAIPTSSIITNTKKRDQELA